MWPFKKHEPLCIHHLDTIITHGQYCFIYTLNLPLPVLSPSHHAIYEYFCMYLKDKDFLFFKHSCILFCFRKLRVIPSFYQIFLIVSLVFFFLDFQTQNLSSLLLVMSLNYHLKSHCKFPFHTTYSCNIFIEETELLSVQSPIVRILIIASPWYHLKYSSIPFKMEFGSRGSVRFKFNSLARLYNSGGVFFNKMACLVVFFSFLMLTVRRWYLMLRSMNSLQVVKL